MRAGSQVSAIVNQELASAIFSLEATIVSVAGGKAVVQPTARRIFGDNDEPYEYEAISDVRLLSLVWNSSKSGISGEVKAGDSCLLIAISHSDAQEPDHKTLSACAAITGFNDMATHTMPDSVGIRIYHVAANITLDDNNITVDNGGGAKLVLDGGGITLDAPAGFTVNANTQINGNVGIAGDMTTTAGAGGGSGRAAFASDVQINGTSAAVDHVSNGISGSGHKHKENGDGGGTTDAPQ
ncbi:phage baseplate protein [Buttiauxella sp. B2]|uniref:phage baseplate protein n=1 Tax=Buttiauxella sp. B2 TaxID=2587812 RepID=UPI00111F8A22|nr:phage baseplate protein [Buttiauxella sp. B2]TNV22494.1 phage baseplate protein [Buttiauxella sp. B2]